MPSRKPGPSFDCAQDKLNVRLAYRLTIISGRVIKKIFDGQVSRKLPTDIQTTARRKLLYLDEADSLQDLRAPPGNRLETLKGNRAGQHSIRINDQWRICFKWVKNNAHEVEIVDYH